MAFTAGDFNIFLGVFFGVPLGLLFLYSLTRCYVVEQGTAMVVEKWGRYSRTCYSGFHFLIPFVEKPRPVLWRESIISAVGGRERVKVVQTNAVRIDLRERLADAPTQTVITRDNTQLQVHMAIFYRVVNARMLAYQTYDPSHAMEKLTQTVLRSIIGECGLDDTLASRDYIERGIKSRIHRICLDWGIEVMSCELLEINPTATIQHAMHRQLKAERTRRAAIVTAEGERQKRKTESEGHAQAEILQAQGEQRVAELRAQAFGDAKVAIVKAEADALRTIQRAMDPFGESAAEYLIGTKYIKMLVSMAQGAKTREVYLPYEDDVMGGLSRVG